VLGGVNRERADGVRVTRASPAERSGGVREYGHVYGRERKEKRGDEGRVGNASDKRERKKGRGGSRVG
jgi:hypothetical protein